MLFLKDSLETMRKLQYLRAANNATEVAIVTPGCREKVKTSVTAKY